MVDEMCEVGNLPASEGYALLSSSSSAMLIDVRSAAEWTFVGTPDLESLGKQAVLAEWQRFPLMERTQDFASKLTDELTKRRVPASAPLLFICRSGARSLAAAQSMAACGYSHCINVVDGFEGPCDRHGHRGTIQGWKVAGLPWKQG